MSSKFDNTTLFNNKINELNFAEKLKLYEMHAY